MISRDISSTPINQSHFISFNKLRINLFIAIVVLVSTILVAQNGERSSLRLGRDKNFFPINTAGVWNEIYPQIPRVTYWGVTFVNNDTGIAVGEGGAIIKTNNGGKKWFWIESNIESTLKTITSVNNGTRFISAGDEGKIIISEDGGETWNSLQSPTTESLWNIQMINDKIGWMVGEGATALKTTDGGLSWIQQITPYTSLPYWDVDFIDTLRGYICCNSGIVLKTIDGGENWQILQAGDTRSLFTIYAFDSLWISAAGFAGKAVYSTDGGNSWINSGGNFIPSESNKVKFINDTLGYLATGSGIFRSTDKGINWYSTSIGITYMTTNISFPNNTVGHILGSYMYLVKTTDEGYNWKKTIINDDFLNVYYNNENCGLINSSKFIYKTCDGGETLDTLTSFPYYDIYNIHAMEFIDSTIGFVGSSSLTIYKTTNGGNSWYQTNIQNNNDTIGTIRKIYFRNSNIGFALSADGKIFKTIDQGENWNLKLTITINNPIFTGIFASDDSTYWAVGTNTYPFEIYKSFDFGETWITDTVDFMDMRDIVFINNEAGLIVGNNKLYKTTNAGNNWFLDSSISNFGQGRFGYYDENNFFISGTSVYKTTNGGNEWIYYPELEEKSWQNSISLITTQLGYLVGNTGLIYQYKENVVPVELFNFNGSIIGNNTVLNWSTASELNNLGFEVQRKKWNENVWISLSFVKGNGSSTTINNYSYEDILDEAGSYFYRLKQIDFDGSYKYSSEIKLDYSTQLRFEVFQNFPNPFNPATTIKYDLPKDGLVQLEVFDILGRRITTLVNEYKTAGSYEHQFDASSLVSGVYVYKLQAGDFVNSKKMILLK